MLTWLKDILTGKKLFYTIATIALSSALGALKSAHPDWVIPSSDQVIALGAGLIGCHTITDVIAIVKDAITAYKSTPK
jgi:hypothetical protein